jgi:hypothetical protein
MKKRSSLMVNPDTGEITDEIYEGDRVRIIRKESLDYLVNTQSDFQEWHIENFYKANAPELRKIMQDLSVYEKAFIFAMATYVGYDDCCIKYPNGNDIGTEDLIKLTGFGRTKLFETIESLVKKDVIYKGKNSHGRQYFINPWLFCKGNRINVVLKAMFKNYRIRIRGGVKWKDI